MYLTELTEVHIMWTIISEVVVVALAILKSLRAEEAERQQSGGPDVAAE